MKEPTWFESEQSCLGKEVPKVERRRQKTEDGRQNQKNGVLECWSNGVMESWAKTITPVLHYSRILGTTDY